MVGQTDEQWIKTNSGNELINSRILALRQACSISSCVTSDAGLMAPSRILNRTVPA